MANFMKNNKLMTQKEESLMEIFWTHEEPLTIAKVMEFYGKENLNQATVFRRVKSLFNKGYLKVYGLEKNNTKYTRRFVPALTKEEYAAVLLSEYGMESTSLVKIVLSMLGYGKRKETSQDEKEKLIKELESIIACIRSQDE